LLLLRLRGSALLPLREAALNEDTVVLTLGLCPALLLLRLGAEEPNLFPALLLLRLSDSA
jgi:hypothetical protein